MNLKSEKVQKYWSGKPVKIDYSQMDQLIIRQFSGTHPAVVHDWLPRTEGVFQVDRKYTLTKKQKKHRIMLKFEKLFGIELSKKHFKLVK